MICEMEKEPTFNLNIFCSISAAKLIGQQAYLLDRNCMSKTKLVHVKPKVLQCCAQPNQNACSV